MGGAQSKRNRARARKAARRARKLRQDGFIIRAVQRATRSKN